MRGAVVRWWGLEEGGERCSSEGEWREGSERYSSGGVWGGGANKGLLFRGGGGQKTVKG